MEIIAFIPARSGSTRLKNKNISKINKRPLIYWTVIKAIKSKIFNRIIFSSDSVNYYKILIYYLKKDNLDFSKIEFDNRSKKFSKTKSKIFDYLRHELIKKNKINRSDLIVQLLPTYPLRKIRTIKKIVEIAKKNKKNTFSVCKYDFHVSFAMEIKKNKWNALFKKAPLITGKTQSQTQKTYYHPNGVANCLWVKNLNKNIKSIYFKAIPVVVSRSESHDIDTKEDFEFIKLLFNV